MMDPAMDAAAQTITIEHHLRSLTACLSQFLNRETVAKALLAAGLAVGLDDATLQVKLQELGAIVKDEDGDKKKKKKQKRVLTGEEKTRNVSLYSLFINRQCAASKAHDAQYPLPAGEKRSNSLKVAIAAWSSRSEEEKHMFEQQYGGLVNDLNARIQLGEKITDLGAEIDRFETEHGLPGFVGPLLALPAPSTSGKSKQNGAPSSATKRKPEAGAVAVKGSKKAKGEVLLLPVKEESSAESSSEEEDSDDEDEDEDEDEDASVADAAAQGSAGSDEGESDSEELQAPPPEPALKPVVTAPSKKKVPKPGKVPTAAPKPAAGNVPAAPKPTVGKVPASTKPAAAGGSSKPEKVKLAKAKSEKVKEKGEKGEQGKKPKAG